jgi:hypothetical protein
MMTTPYERTQAVLDTREYLQLLASANEITIDGLVQSVALGLLRHYPLDIDLDVSASASPGIWAAPKHPRVASTAASERQKSSLGRLAVLPSPIITEERHMLSENSLDLEIALQKIYQLSLEDGDLGYAYWHQVGQLLRRAAGMQAEIDLLAKELELCRSMLAHKTG